MPRSPSPPDRSPDGSTLKALVSTKLVPPRGAGRMIARADLSARLLAARRRRCLLLQGPAGCGKTSTLVGLRQALLPLGFDVAWLTLTPEDNEPTRLLDYLLASLALAAPAVTREAADFAGRGIDSEAVERTLIALVRAIAAHPRELVLVLDDLHHLVDPRIHEALQWLIDQAPANLHLVLASRGAVPLALDRARAEGQLLELDVRDLRFSPAESEIFLRSQLGHIEQRDALLLHELSDGWAAGLQLLAINWMKRRQELAGSDAKVPGDFVRTHVQDPQAFAAYFEKEVLSRLSPVELELLIGVSACSRFCASLCAALAGRPEARADMAALLARLEGENLFIVPVESGERETWYRLHPLLRETLHERLDRRSEDQRLRLHRMAWLWFRDQGLIDEAVRQAVAAGEGAAAAALVEKSASGLAVRGELRKLIALVRQLPPAEVQARIGLRLWMIRVELFARELDAFSAHIERLRPDIPPDDAISHFTLTLMEATLAVQRDDTDVAMALLPRLLAAPEGADALAIGGRDNILSWLFMHRGDYERSRRIQHDNAIRLIGGVPLRGTPSGTLQGRCLVGLSYALEGRMTQAERIYRDVLREAGQDGSACVDPACLATALLGEVLYEHDETDAALRLLEDRVDVLERVSMPDSVLRVHRTLAAAHWVAGRRLESLAWLERLEDYSASLGLDRLLVHSLTMQVHWRLQLGDIVAAELALRRADEIDARHPDAEDSALGEIAVVAERARIRWAFARGRLDEAGTRIDALIARIEVRGRQRLVAQLRLIQAAIELRRGRRDAARDCALQALRRGHRLGLVRSLLDADPAALALVREIGAEPSLDPVLAFYVERLTQGLGATRNVPDAPQAATGATTAQRAPVEALSDRERDVLALLAQAMPNKKIAAALGLSIDTVKWHLKNIYGKLGVSGRDEAVAWMRDAPPAQ
ncbi:LuxR C-terminal-related transcriptional regulator [Variovorax saccharolyticus]|uniref:LuxR C-terminal-related transcriptional regulator n=1 Tax=Variovorax saccharolyticus TaxID=3053516 RepID=UPI002576B435|nr:LuxR C-terminal-related transcriptional regulator [Variovorax sp. J31P216]MDM0025530.1 LuxR C-terminal-related transcriptional regulator [Variovorax sp. J31P216]